MSKSLPWISLIALFALYCVPWWSRTASRPSEGCLGSRGRIAATEHVLLTPQAGRIARILVDCGDTVTAGQVVARLDSRHLEEQLAQARLALLRAQTAAKDAQKYIEQQVDERTTVAQQTLRQGDVALARMEQTDWHGKIISLRSELFAAQAAIIAAHKNIQRLQAEIDSCLVKSPIPGQVLYRAAREGDLVARDAKLLQLLDLREVSMRFSLPADTAEKMAIGTEVRLALDLASPVVLPAQVASIAPGERKLARLWNVLRQQPQPQREVLAKIAPEIVTACAGQLAEGISGRAYVRFDRNSPWPTALQVGNQDACHGNNKWNNSKIGSFY